ncbi:sugar ABC transporter ATP-binding protein [Anaeromyxobacter oryzae]|uniref:Sugar ABC transporter ATP-binding protein n=1 Tax=Anaeromyxobacter oryzae TaxID=2918170 RepID=A0ABN6MN39_9BACT|nr:sugar ABC transporter ATP-binding protein [Anaeromyxobacter oryzae]BDG01297.1 sugar ABC transporter ATP-binding protein [Anaeromyxobacter oryzae]
MPFLEVRDIRKEFPGVVALDRVDFSVDLGRVHALAGENGAGKSTLVKILTGVEAPNRGQVLIDGRDALAQHALFDEVAYVPQELNLFPHMTVAENLFMPFGKSGVGGLFLSHAALNQAAEPFLERFKIAARPEQRVRDVGVSDQQLLQIARASTRRRFKVLILDEPTSALTDAEVERLFAIVRELRATGHAVIFISHKLEEMFAIGDEVTVLRNGEKVGHAEMGAMTQAELIRLMSGKDVKVDDVFRPAGPTGRRILEVEDLSGRGFEGVSFSLHEGEILGFAGLVGAGRSEVMQTLFGFRPASRGAAWLDGAPWKLGDTAHAVRHGMLYLSESRKEHGILPLLSLRENIAISVLGDVVTAGLVSDARERKIVQDVIRTYDIKTSSMDKKVMFLSGGNQQKAIIGRAMACRPRILIFDEPTKGIDVRTKVDIYGIMKALAEKGVGIILVSSELNELQKCANRIIAMHHGRIVGEFATERTGQRELVGAIIGAAPEQAPAGAPAASEARAT